MKSVVVIGGGIAGLAAATTLAERKVKVTVLEREPRLGGRVASWPITLPDGTRLIMERGFHAFFRQYSYLRGLMRRFDPQLSRLVPLADYPILGPGGELMRFDKLPKKTPFNVIAVALRGRKWIGLRDLFNIDVRRALAMIGGKDIGRFDDETAKDYLDGLGFPPEARRMLFDVFAHSFFNPEAEMSAAELVMMFRFYFTANPEGLVFDVLDDAFGPAFVDPWAAHLAKLGVAIHTSRPAASIDRVAGGFVVETSTDPIACDAVVLATEVPGLHALAKTSGALKDLVRGKPLAERLLDLQVTAPFAVWRLFLDKQPRADRDPFAGTAGLGRLDNISIYERFEKESRAYAQRTGNSVVELHAYGIEPLRDDAAVADLKTELRAGLDTLYPELAGARSVHEEWLVRRDCPAFPPGSYKSRPRVKSGVAGIALAGDFVHLPFPSALMERAAASGVLAAHTLLES